MKNIYVSIKTNGTLRKTITKAFSINLNRATLSGNRLTYPIHNNEEVYGVLRDFVSVGEAPEIWLERCFLRGVEALKEVVTKAVVVLQLHDTANDKYITYKFSHKLTGSYSIDYHDTGDIYHWANTVRVSADDLSVVDEYMSFIRGQDNVISLDKLANKIGVTGDGHLEHYNAIKLPRVVKYYRDNERSYIQFETNTFSQRLLDDLRSLGELIQNETSPSLNVTWTGWDKINNRSPRKISNLLTKLVSAKENTQSENEENTTMNSSPYDFNAESRYLLNRIVFNLPLRQQDADATLLSLVNAIREKIDIVEKDSLYRVIQRGGGLVGYDMLITCRVPEKTAHYGEQRSLIRGAILEYLVATGDSLLGTHYPHPLVIFKTSFGLAVVSKKTEEAYRRTGMLDDSPLSCIPDVQKSDYHPMMQYYSRCVTVTIPKIPSVEDIQKQVERMGSTHYFITISGVKWQRMGIESLFLNEDGNLVDFGIVLPMPEGMSASEKIIWMENNWGTSAVEYHLSEPSGDDAVLHHIVVRGDSAAFWRNALLKAIINMRLNKVKVSIDMQVRDSSDSGYGEDRTYVISEEGELKIIQHVDVKKWVIGEDDRPQGNGTRLL